MDLDLSPADMNIAEKITARAVEMLGDPADRLTFLMDLAATHLNGCPLDLQKLLDAPDLDFLHDILGINSHLDQSTGRLEGCFLPRCARPTE